MEQVINSRKQAKFVNFTKEDFTGHWNGKAQVLKAGETYIVDDYLARHYAKHLTNRELLKTNIKGVLIHKDGDKFTSPKHPEEVPAFMKFYNEAYIPEEDARFNEEEEKIEEPKEIKKNK